MQTRLQVCYNRVTRIAGSEAFGAAARGVGRRQRQLKDTAAALRQAKARLLAQKGGGLGNAARLAHSLDPYAVLARGYAMVQDEQGRVIPADELKQGQRFFLSGKNTLAECRAGKITPRKEDAP